ncbi:MAG: hypothetical protein OEW11_08910, partial [Nitrospirota bacterium]|nr:hypothetical protein [Nitrospirota bacterium]
MKTIFNSTASKAAAAVAVAAVAGLVAAGCGSDNAVGAPVVGNSNKPASLYWSSTLADNQALVLNLVRGMGMDPVTDAMGEMPMSAGDLDPINLNSGCPKQTLNYTAAAYAAAAGFTYPATINYTQGWLTLGGAATCTADATGNYTGTWDSMNGSFYANLTGLGSTTLTDFTANYFTNQSISLTQGGNETLIDKSTANDRQTENNMATMVAINFSGGLPLSGSINGSGWGKYQDGGNWFGTTLAHNQIFNSKTVTNVTWAATTNVWATTYTTAFNGGYAVSNGSVPAMPT